MIINSPLPLFLGGGKLPCDPLQCVTTAPLQQPTRLHSSQRQWHLAWCEQRCPHFLLWSSKCNRKNKCSILNGGILQTFVHSSHNFRKLLEIIPFVSPKPSCLQLRKDTSTTSQNPQPSRRIEEVESEISLTPKVLALESNMAMVVIDCHFLSRYKDVWGMKKDSFF